MRHPGLMTFVIATLCCAGVAQAQSAAPPRIDSTLVVMLGSGTPTADPDRSGPAVAIIVRNHTYLVDAGPGVVRRAGAAARESSLPSLNPPGLQIVFLTHLHSDHTLGLPDLMLTPWVLERPVPLEVYGPPGTSDMVTNLTRAYSADIDIRTTGGEASHKTAVVANAHEIKEGLVYRDSLVTVTAFEVAHGKWPHAFAYRFVTPDRTIVIAGDTGPTDAVANACNGCDVLLHEVYSDVALKRRTPAWQAYHTAYHTSASQLAAIASKAKPKLLLLYHQLYWGDTDANLLSQIRAGYSGVVISSKDLGVY